MYMMVSVHTLYDILQSVHRVCCAIAVFNVVHANVSNSETLTLYTVHILLGCTCIMQSSYICAVVYS
jgi:hypothetical protein